MIAGRRILGGLLLLLLVLLLLDRNLHVLSGNSLHIMGSGSWRWGLRAIECNWRISIRFILLLLPLKLLLMLQNSFLLFQEGQINENAVDDGDLCCL